MDAQHIDGSRRALLGGLLALPAAAIAPRLARCEDAAVPRLETLLSVAEFEAVARAVLPPAHFGFLATGVDDDRTVAWNHEAFGQLEISVRRFADVSDLDTGIKLFGTRWPSPVYLSAVGSQRAFHPETSCAKHRSTRVSTSLE